jgi:hypothetical protein
MDPTKVMNALNAVQREGDPDAYVPDIVIMQRKKEEEQKVERLLELHYAQKMKERDALFDFDDQYDNLSEISEKYAPAATSACPPADQLHFDQSGNKIRGQRRQILTKRSLKLSNNK